MKLKPFLLLTGLFFLATVIPLVAWVLLTHLIPDDLVCAFQLFQLQTLLAFAILTTAVCLFLKRNDIGENRWAALILYAASLCILVVVNQESVRSSWDYAQIEKAAEAIVQGSSPYSSPTYVLYPPLYAQLMAAIYSVISHCIKAEPTNIWNLIFYLFQCLQLAAALVYLWFAYKLTVKVCRYPAVYAALMATLVGVVSYPVRDTIHMHQVNIFAGALMLIALTVDEASPLIAGFCVALAFFFKVYPALIALVWLIHKRWRPLIWSITGGVILLLLQTCAGHGFQIWNDYLVHASGYLTRVLAHPDQWLFFGPGLITLNYQACTLFHYFRAPEPSWFACRTWANVESVGFACWFIWRCLRLPASMPEEQRFMERICNLLSLGLIVGPSVLIHHYALAAPIVIWTIYAALNRSPVLTVCGLVLMLDFTPRNLSPCYLEAVGLVLLTLARGNLGQSEVANASGQSETERLSS